MLEGRNMILDLGCIERGRGGIKMLFMSRLDCGLGGLRGKLGGFVCQEDLRGESLGKVD